MSIVDGHRASWRRTLLTVSSAMAFVVICGWPYVGWWAHPSLFDDDFLRVGSLRRSTLGGALFRPFNEHMAPLFEAVGWLAWVGAGRQVLATPLAFQVASFAAFGFTAAMLVLWIGREVRSSSATLAALALFCLSSVSAETVLWYSASSFQWAAGASIAGCLAASISTRSSTARGRLGWSLASALASLAGPAFSAIGVLAGPLAALRAAAEVDRPSSAFRRLGWSILPLTGTAGYFLICEQFDYRTLVSSSVRNSFHPASAIWATVRAPGAVLVPGLIGWPEQSRAISGGILAAITLIGLLVALAWARRSRLRPFLLVSLAWIFGGYLLTYATRARPGDPWIFEIQRYHLFPQIGLIGLIVAALAPGLRHLDKGPSRGFFWAACLAGLLAVLQYPRMLTVAERSFRFPDQPRALAAVGRLERICEREGITLPQVMQALEPIQTPWYPRPWAFNPLINLLPTGPILSRLPDDRVRHVLIAGLTAEDRESLFGGMTATRYAFPATAWPGIGSPVDATRVVDDSAGQGGGRPRGSKPFLEFSVGPGADDARALSLQGFRSSRPIEVWWAGDEEDWTSYRSIRWSPGREREGEAEAVTLEMIPHWRRGEVRRVRVMVRDTGPSKPGMVRFLR